MTSSLEDVAVVLDEGEAKSKQDFQRLYAQLEAWRVSEERHIASSKSGYALRRARSKLVSSEALKLSELAANRDENKLAEKQDVIKTVILKVRHGKIVKIR